MLSIGNSLDCVCFKELVRTRFLFYWPPVRYTWFPIIKPIVANIFHVLRIHIANSLSYF